MEVVDARIHEPRPTSPLDDSFSDEVKTLVNVEIAREAIDSVGIDAALVFASQTYIDACISRYPDRFAGALTFDYMAKNLEDQIAAFSRLGRIDQEHLPSGDPRVDVAAVAAGLDVLSIADDVDPAFDLTIDHLGNRRRQSLSQRDGVHFRILQQHVEIIRTGQVATVRHQDFLSASSHSS